MELTFLLVPDILRTIDPLAHLSAFLQCIVTLRPLDVDY